MTRLGAGVGTSDRRDTTSAVFAAIDGARATMGGTEPGFAFVTCTVEHDADAVLAALRERLPDVEVHGITTSLGVLGSNGITMGPHGAVGVLLCGGGGSTFRSSGGELDERNPKASARRIAQAVADRAPGRRPGVLLVNASPGFEEDVLAGVGEVFPGVRAYGGSAADHAIAGQWRVLTSHGAFTNGLALTGVFGVNVGAAYLAPYEPTSQLTHVEKAEGRTLVRLGDKSAGEQLVEWVGDKIQPGNVLAQTALDPLGVRLPGKAGYITVHPARLYPDGKLDVFARIPEGSVVCHMRGTETGLIDSLSRLLDTALADGAIAPEAVRAAFLIYCAGCAGAVGDRLGAGLQRHIGARLGKVPLIGVCTFGEQGHIRGVGNLHSNLSLGLVLLGGG